MYNVSVSVCLSTSRHQITARAFSDSSRRRTRRCEVLLPPMIAFGDPAPQQRAPGVLPRADANGVIAVWCPRLSRPSAQGMQNVCFEMRPRCIYD